MEASTNSDLALLATSDIRRFNVLAAKDDGCVRLTLGEPEFPTPAPVCEAVARSLAKGQTHYPPNNGRPDLLEALSTYMRRHGLGYGPEELVVTCGATEALSATLMAILDPGDEVVVPTPAFGLYETIVRAAHGRVATLDTSCSGFQIRERDLRGVVVCDDVYNRLCYEEGYERFAPRHPELRDQTVVVDSFSKPWAMTGWRLGWLAAAPALKSQIQKMHQYLVSSVPSFLQEAAVVALGCDVEPMRQTYRRRRDYVVGRLEQMGLPVQRPAGAFYAFPDVRSLGMGSEELCERLIREAGVACVPGTCFGAEGFTRLSFCVGDADLKLGLDRIEAFLARL